MRRIMAVLGVLAILLGLKLYSEAPKASEERFRAPTERILLTVSEDL